VNVTKSLVILLTRNKIKVCALREILQRSLGCCKRSKPISRNGRWTKGTEPENGKNIGEQELHLCDPTPCPRLGDISMWALSSSTFHLGILTLNRRSSHSGLYIIFGFVDKVYIMVSDGRCLKGSAFFDVLGFRLMAWILRTYWFGVNYLFSHLHSKTG